MFFSTLFLLIDSSSDSIFTCCIVPVFAVVALTIIFFVQEYIKSARKKRQAKKEDEEKDQWKQDQNKEESERRTVFTEKFTQFVKSPEYIFVKHFAESHRDINTEKDYSRFKTELSKLNKLLINNQWDFSEEELIMALDESRFFERYKASRDKILLNNPQTKEEFIISYLDYFRSDDNASLISLKSLLEENNLLENDEDLESCVQRVEEELELERFEKQLRQGNKTIRLEDVDQLSGYEFEDFLKNLFSKMGYQVEQTRLSGDQGADLVVIKFGEKKVIQAKRFGGKVGNKAVQEIMAAISLYKAQKGIVITNNYLTSAAVELANANNIELIDRDALEELINKYW